MIRLDGSTVLLQWATGGLFFLWVTTRHRLVGLGYGWLMRMVFGAVATGSVIAGRFGEADLLRDAAGIGVALATAVVLVVSVQRRGAGVQGQRSEQQRKSARVAAMAGAAASGGSGSALEDLATASVTMRDEFGRVMAEAEAPTADGPEFPPALDLIAPAVGVIGLVSGAISAGGTVWLAVARTVVGALFLGAVSDAMLLGHWYLVQPGLSRRPIGELNDWLLKIWPLEVALLLVPTGMFSVVNGTIDDHYGGMLGWFWIACAFTTGGLAFVTRLALRERFYSAVMAATGLLYLAILTAFGTDLVARAILAG